MCIPCIALNSVLVSPPPASLPLCLHPEIIYHPISWYVCTLKTAGLLLPPLSSVVLKVKMRKHFLHLSSCATRFTKAALEYLMSFMSAYYCKCTVNYNRRAGGTSCAESSSISVTTDSDAVILFSSFILIMCHQERYLCKVTFKAITTISDYTD